MPLFTKEMFGAKVEVDRDGVLCVVLVLWFGLLHGERIAQAGGDIIDQVKELCGRTFEAFAPQLESICTRGEPDAELYASTNRKLDSIMATRRCTEEGNSRLSRSAASASRVSLDNIAGCVYSRAAL